MAALTGVSQASARETGAQPVSVDVKATQPFSDSGLDVDKGDSITVTADGTIEYKEGIKATQVGPSGIPLAECRARRRDRKIVLPVEGQPCFSLIGRIGAKGKPFGVGKSKTLIAPANGALFLGVNDGQPADNGGAWKVAVTLEPAPGTESSSKSSSWLPIAAIGLGVLLVAGLVWLALKRRRGPAEGEPVPETLARERALVGVGVGEVPGRPGALPFDPESSDVNIFRVALSEGDELEVGYNFFPAGTTVAWRVSRHGVPLAVGEFVAQGGGSEQHFATLPLGTTIEPDAGAVNIAFSWSINEVPFGYSVRRNPRS